MNNNKNQQNIKHVLVAVSGMTPQIITETLYGIYIHDKNSMPSEIHVLTTELGAEKLRNSLMGPDNKLEQFCNDYELKLIPFSEENIHIPMDSLGQKITDVRTEQEQEIIADFITQFIRQKTADNNVAIHASLAGGRKTMGFSIGYAMSLFGRPLDRLSHVLVNEPYENIPEFFYPTPPEKGEIWQMDRNNKRHDARKAVVTLASIPFVLMREEMPDTLLSNEHLSYTDIVNRINRAMLITAETASIRFDFERLVVNCDGYEIAMKPDNFAFYAWMARNAREYPGEGIDRPRAGMTRRELFTRLREFLLAILSEQHVLYHDLEKEQDIEEILTRVNDHLKSLGHKRVLQEGNKNQGLFDKTKPDDELRKKHEGLWDRLLRETNTALNSVMGKRLAEVYKIQTIDNEKGNVDTAEFDYKGLLLSPENIHID